MNESSERSQSRPLEIENEIGTVKVCNVERVLYKKGGELHEITVSFRITAGTVSESPNLTSTEAPVFLSESKPNPVIDNGVFPLTLPLKGEIETR